MSPSRVGHPRLACTFLTIALCVGGTRIDAAGQPPPPSSEPGERTGTSMAEKVACIYLLVGGSIMVYYGPREREGGVLTMDGKSEVVGGAAAVGISLALLRDIVKKSSRSHRP
jgi:hypothetical protein